MPARNQRLRFRKALALQLRVQAPEGLTRSTPVDFILVSGFLHVAEPEILGATMESGWAPEPLSAPIIGTMLQIICGMDIQSQYKLQPRRLGLAASFSHLARSRSCEFFCV